VKLKYLLFIILIQINIFATTLLTYNTYNRTDRVDIMLSFDTPYRGKVFLQKKKDTFIITLNDVSFNKIITKNINSKIVNKIKIIPNKKNINIFLKSKEDIAIIASKTTDGFGLRIRAKILTTKAKNVKTSVLDNKKFNTDLKMDTKNYGENRYYIVLAILLTGSSNQLLDKFTTDDTIKEEEDFEQIFAKNREKLDEFLKIKKLFIYCLRTSGSSALFTLSLKAVASAKFFEYTCKCFLNIPVAFSP